ncbi:hypothetical protein SUDANB120_00011 [Streptomyces sp. enrichment culture]|uniref:hypothetical protein n=1 Tax=Streptomyces sp. enrichment culture TaxID=1795815 RepID=UPI003F55EDAE
MVSDTRQDPHSTRSSRTPPFRRARTTPLPPMGGYGVDGRRVVRLTAGMVLYAWAVAGGAVAFGRLAPGLDWLVFATAFLFSAGLLMAMVILHRAAWTAVLSVTGLLAVPIGASDGKTGMVVSGAVLWTILVPIAGRRGYWRRRRGIEPWWDH